MSEVVVRMEMPTNCAKCDLHYRCSESRGIYGFDAIREMMRLDTVNDKREDEHCLFVCSLPEGHGTLIDLETAAEGLSERYNSCHMTCGAVMQFLDGLPTIVPAERSET